MQNIIDLTKNLVSIPSWVDVDTNEIKISDFIFDYLQNNSKLKLTKQMVVDGRYNILAQNGEDVDIFVIGHTDTVGIDKSWLINPTNPIIKNGRLYGRGTTDMKSGLAAMMLLACQNDLPTNIGFLFYIDEEYSFLGMTKFIAEYGNKLKLKTIISLDGSELEIANGCRGLIEVEFEVIGISCHAATPQNGVSAITAGIDICRQLEKQIDTSVNIGLISGGSAPNLVAGTCRFVIDIRPSLAKINGQLVEETLLKFAKSTGVKINNIKINYDFGSWETPQNKLEKFGLPFKNIRDSGYIDMQLLWRQFGKPDCLTIGAGTQSTAHTASEFVEINKLEKLPQILDNIINVTQKK